MKQRSAAALIVILVVVVLALAAYFAVRNLDIVDLMMRIHGR